MKTAKNTVNKYSAYRDFYNKVVKEMKSADSRKEKEVRKCIVNDLEATLKGRDLVIEGNLCSL
ncbi:hypothetical protein D3C87_148400 [compost metagenome]